MSEDLLPNRSLKTKAWTWFKFNYGYILTALICLGFLDHYYGEILWRPNDFMMSPSGDGLKNYYTLAYHLKNDASLGHFGGMAHPYGDHVTYTDGQPFLGLLLWLVPGAAGYSVGVINLMMLLSFVASGLVMFKIFRLFELPQVGAALAASSIAFLSPQIWRLGGHYSLAYAFVVPLTILWLIQAMKTSQMKYSIYLGVLALIFLYIHPYLALMVVFTSGLALAFRVLHLKQFKNWRAYWPIVTSTIAPIVIFTLINLLVESHPNRPSKPIGFFQHHATVETIFVPNHPPFKHMMSQIIKVKSQPWEGWSYIGLTAIICMLVFVITGIVQSIRQKKATKLLIPFPKPFGYLIPAALLLLLLSMCLPFRWGLEDWADSAGPIRQFRALGRFSWVFFYTMTIWSFVILARYVKHKGWLIGLLCACAILNFIEGNEPHKGVSNLVRNHPNKFLSENLNDQEIAAINLVKKSDCSAIISLPFFHVGSEYFTYVGSEPSLYNTILYTYYTGIPAFNSWLGRSSIDETIAINSLFTPNFLDKPIVNHLNMNESVLIIEHGGTQAGEKKVLEGAVLIGQANGAKFYKNKLSNVFTSTSKQIKSDPAFEQINSANQFEIRALGNENYFIEDFEDNGNSDQAYMGRKGYEGMKKDYHPFPIDSSLIHAHDRIHVSFWFKCDEPGSTTGIMCYLLEQGDDGFKHLHDPKGMTTIRYIDGEWGLMTLEMPVGDKNHKYTLSIAGQEGNESIFHIDNILFHGSKGVYYGKKGQVYFNNYPISD